MNLWPVEHFCPPFLSKYFLQNPYFSMYTYCMYLIGKGIDMKDIRITPKKTCPHFETRDKFRALCSDEVGTTTKTGTSFGDSIRV